MKDGATFTAAVRRVYDLRFFTFRAAALAAEYWSMTPSGGHTSVPLGGSTAKPSLPRHTTTTVALAKDLQLGDAASGQVVFRQ